jgi:hypothetical protein
MNCTWALSLNVPQLTHAHYPGISGNLNMRTIPECAQTDPDALSRNVRKLTHGHYPGISGNLHMGTIPECAQSDTDALSRHVPELTHAHYPKMCLPTQQIEGNSPRQDSCNSRQQSNSKICGGESELLIIVARLTSSGGKQSKNSSCLF